MLGPIVFIGLTLAAAPALAAATAVQELAPGTTARLISSDTIADGVSYAALELQLPPGTHTYWRVPGESGIPTEIDLSGSTGIADPQVQWPLPSIETSAGGLDYVYSDHLVIPIRLKPTASGGNIEASVTLGVCSDVCVPAQAKFSLPVSFSTGDAPQWIRIQTALAQTPIAWDQPDNPVASVTASADGTSLELRGLDASIDPALLIAEIGDTTALFAAPQKSPDGTLWTLKLLGESGTKGLVGRQVELTFATAKGPYVVSRVIGPAG